MNERGNVLGMMPHPERCCEESLGGTDGIPIFQSIIKALREKQVRMASLSDGMQTA